MHIRVVAVGKLHEPYLKVGVEEYLKRLRKYANVEIIELKEQRTLKEEAALIAPKLHGFVITLDATGKELSSESFAELLKQHDKITIVIGSHQGLAPELKQKANLLLSFSRLTFPHQVARLLLVEQLYRGFTILRGEKYHK